jgi:polyphenol oxidase
MIHLTDNNMLMGFESLKKFSNLIHFVTTRHGGISNGAYNSFNCSPFSGDDEACVKANQEKLKELIGVTNLIIPHQTHGKEVKIVETICSQQELEGIDALITREKNLCLCISTADCVPVFIYDPIKKVIALIHAGWRGTVAGITGKTIRCMVREFGVNPEDLIGVIGPSIALNDFEVGDEVYDSFEKNGFEMSAISFFNEKTHKHHIDLWQANIELLVACGVNKRNIEVSGISTFQYCNDYFSARRLGIHSGRILSGIMLK